MPNYAARREIGSNFGAMLGAYFGQMAAKRSREQLGKDVESLREIADKSLSTDEPMTPDDYANRLSKLYAHHGVRRDEGFQTDVGLFADKAGKRQSAAFAKQLYPDRPLYSESTPTGPLTQEDTAEINKYNQGQSRTRTLLSRFSPSQQFGYYTGQQNAEAAAKAKTEADAASWTKFFLNLNKPKPDEMVTLYGPNGATKQVPVPYGKEFVPEEGWSVSKPLATREIHPTTAMGAYLNQNPNATPDDIAAFAQKLKAPEEKTEPKMVTLYGPSGATKQVPIPPGQEYIPSEGWSFSKPAQGPATGTTDISAYAQLMSDEYALHHEGTKPPPGMVAGWMREFKRAQAEEVGINRLASKTVDAQTAQQIAYNGEIGKELAKIATAADLIKAKGEQTQEDKINSAKARMTSDLAFLSNQYLKLNSVGGILNVERSTIENVGASLRSSSFGQAVGRIAGTDEQSIRETIKRLKPLLVQEIRQSTNMGARGMDSEKELEFYLNAATNEKTDIQSNIAAIVVLDESYGDGRIAQQLRSLTDPSLISRISQEGDMILNGGVQAINPQAPQQPAPAVNAPPAEPQPLLPPGIKYLGAE